MVGATLPQVLGTQNLSSNSSLSLTTHPLPNSLGVYVSVDFFEPLPVTAGGNSSILPFRFCRHAEMFTVAAAVFTAEGTANMLAKPFISLWGCPSSLLSDSGLQFCAPLATAVYKLLGIHKLTTTVYNPSGNGGVERVNHATAQVLAMVFNEHLNDWDAHLPHVEYLYNTSVGAATGLAPSEAHIEHLPRLPFAVFDRSYGGTHQASIATISPVATLLASTNSAPTNSCVSSTPSQSPG